MGRRGEGVGLTVAMGGGRLVLDARLMRSSRRDMSLSEICGNEHEKIYKSNCRPNSEKRLKNGSPTFWMNCYTFRSPLSSR